MSPSVTVVWLVLFGSLLEVSLEISGLFGWLNIAVHTDDKPGTDR